MLNFLLAKEDVLQFFKGDYLPFTAASLVLLGLLVVSGLLVYFLKKDYFNKFLYAVSGSMISYIVMTIIYFNKIKQGTWEAKSKELWLMVVYIFVGMLVIFSIALIVAYFLNKDASKKTRTIVKASVYSILGVALTLLTILFSVAVSKTAYIKFKNNANKLKFNANPRDLIIFTVFATIILFAIAIFYLMTNKDKKKVKSTRLMADAAITLSLSFALSYIKLFSMPQGGSITLASVVPIAIFAYVYGPKQGLQVGLIYSILQLMQGAYLVHPIQILLDYIIPFTCIGLAGVFRKLDFKFLHINNRNCNPAVNIILGIALYSVLRFISSFISGTVFFSSVTSNTAITLKEYLFNKEAVAFSAGYNAPYVFADMAIAFIAAAPVMLSKQIQRIVNERMLSNQELIEQQKTA